MVRWLYAGCKTTEHLGSPVHLLLLELTTYEFTKVYTMLTTPKNSFTMLPVSHCHDNTGREGGNSIALSVRAENKPFEQCRVFREHKTMMTDKGPSQRDCPHFHEQSQQG